MEDLSSLRLSLGVRSVRTAPGQAAPPEDDGLGAPTLAQEIYRKYAGKTQPESRQLVAILGAVQEVVRGQGLEVTPTAMFAALMASLEKPETLASSEVLAAMCHLLSLVLARVPNAILRAKFGAGSALLCGVVEAKQGEAAVVKNAVPCLGQLLAAHNPADWPSAIRPFNMLLSLSLDSRAKVRRAAQSAVGDVLAGLQAAPAALGQASEEVLKLCKRVLPGPEAAAHAAAAAPSKKRQQAEEAIAAAVADALHLLGALKQWLPLLSSAAVAPACDLLLKLFPLRQPLLSRHATDALAALAAAPGGHLSAKGLAELLSAALGADTLWDRRDADTTVAAIKLLEDGFCRLAAADAALCAARLPRAVHALVTQLAAEQESVRYAAGACLKNLIAECVDDGMVEAALAGGTAKPPPLLSVLAALEGSLGPHYQDAWDACLPVCAEMIERLGAQGAPLAGGLLERIGELCAGGDEAAAASGGAIDDALLLVAQNALGQAMQALGPEAVLAALPLNLAEGLAGTGEARTWLLPLLRMHVRGARLGYWGKVLLPLARELGARAAAAASNPARAREAQVCGALEAQLWATLPSFCSWAQDTAEAFKLYAKPLAAAFEKRADLRVTICHALRRLSTQNRAALAAAGQPVGHADPCAVMSGGGGDEDGLAASQEEQAHLDVPDSYTAQVALENVAALRALAKNWVPLLLNTFLATPAVQRGQVEEAISAYACVCDPATLATFFRAAVTKLIKVTQQAASGELGPGAVLEGGDTDTERRCAFLELSLSLAGGLDVAGLQTLYKAAAPGMQEKDAAVQKKSYKVLAYLCEARPDFLQPHFQEVVDALLAAQGCALSAAKRNRLRCLKAAVLAMAQPDGPRVAAEEGADRAEATKQMVASMVSEIILAVKERNKQTRATAFELLVQIAHAMHEAEPPPPGLGLGLGGDAAMVEDGTPAERGGLHTLFTMVLGGLVGATPHMISAAVMALARLLYEFAPLLAGLVPDLLPAVLMLLRTKAREVIKSVLGFVKVVSLRLPADDLERFLPQILEGCLLWAEDSKNKFRAKVRWIVEKLAKRCGFDAVARHMPEAHAKLLSHIRKENNRKERRRSEAGSQMDVDEAEETRSRKSRATSAARTARRSEWNEDVFSDSDDEGARTARTARTKLTEGARSRGQQSRHAGGAVGGLLAGSHAGADPVDLLDRGTSRQLVAAAAGRGGQRRGGGDDGPDFGTDAAGRMIIKDDRAAKRKRYDDGWDSEDSDFEDLKGFERSGLSLALKGAKSVALAPSIAASLGGRSLGAKSAGAISRGSKLVGGKSTASHGERSAKHAKGSQHSGDRFKAKKKGTGGDVKGGAKVEPYAYWPLDRRLMNRRQQKAKGAKQGLDKIVAAAKAGAAKGHKAKRQRR
ncbi:ARM repeat superfamily [Chlorella sorokiniana]|uniref:ARM repeat superfamily n=1 Tax=Chlorella sorokiniana TaxID=3076 RepID=A0A2P6U254_CHLSO|nr:ARM repeat superfamily [Chlorella sorokiniana]|eukprot:PRW60392.1 ARM repeat superfamily [Chlorella sorokiniana]